MNPRVAQVNFSRGELAPHLYGRYDTDAWKAGLAKARNVVVLKYGGVTKRPGTRLVAEVLDSSSANRLVPFQFSLEQTYALEMGQGYMSPCAVGGRLLEEEQAITAITNAPDAQITMAYHGYAAGDRIYLTGIAGPMGVLLNSRAWTVVTIVDASNFTIDADTTNVAAFTAATGGVVHSAPPPPVVPPVVPPPAVEPEPPVIYGGGSGDFRQYAYYHSVPF